MYIPPFRLKQMMAEAAEDKSSEQYQKMMWEALRKTLNGIINKVSLPQASHASMKEPAYLLLHTHTSNVSWF